MKMKKLLASGVASALAVTSLATVASAEETTKTFELGKSYGYVTQTSSILRNYGATVGYSADQKTAEMVGVRISPAYGSATIAKARSLGDATLKLTGYKIDEKGNKTKVDQAVKMRKYISNNGTADDESDDFFMYYVYVHEDTVKDYNPNNGEVAPSYFDIIESVEMIYSFNTGATFSESVYSSWQWETGNGTIEHGDWWDGNWTAKVMPAFTFQTAPWVANGTLTSVDIYNSTRANNDAIVNTKLAAKTNIASALIANGLTMGGYSFIDGDYMEFVWGGNGTTTGTAGIWYPDLAMTTATKGGDLDRLNIWPLSKTSDWHEQGASGDVLLNDQSYKGDDMSEGTSPIGFNGLASQVADFFNKQTNGTITFKFTPPSSSSGSTWLNGGVPSTEVGLKQYLSGVSVSDFALFFNYNTSTGRMFNAQKLDLASGTVTFEIDEYLDQCGGLTQATLQDIYYGLANGIKCDVDGQYDLHVSQIILAYGDDDEDNGDVEADDDDDIEADDDDDDIDDVDDDDDDIDVDDDDDEDDFDDFDDDNDDEDDAPADIDDVDDEDDDDDVPPVTVDDDDDDDEPPVVVDDDNDDEGSDVGGADDSMVSDDADDNNPITGVSLAVIPALVAAAAVVISKKRK